jgi:hypothetical protein
MFSELERKYLEGSMLSDKQSKNLKHRIKLKSINVGEHISDLRLLVFSDQEFPITDIEVQSAAEISQELSRRFSKSKRIMELETELSVLRQTARRG